MNFVLVFAHCIVSEIYWRVLAEIPPRVIYYPALKNTCTSYFLHVFSFFFLLIKCGLACSKNYLRGWVIIVVIELNLGFCSLYCIVDRELPAAQCSKCYEISDMGFFIKIYNQIVILDHWYWSFLMVYNHFCCKK